MNNIWSFIAKHAKAVWDAVVNWVQKSNRTSLAGAIVLLMLSLVLTSALVVLHIFVDSVHRDPTLDILFQVTAYVNQGVTIALTIAFAVAGLLLLYTVVKVRMANSRLRTTAVEARRAALDADKAGLGAATTALEELENKVATGQLEPEKAIPLISMLVRLMAPLQRRVARANQQVDHDKNYRPEKLGLPPAKLSKRTSDDQQVQDAESSELEDR